jgi:hypothetical protein
VNYARRLFAGILLLALPVFLFAQAQQSSLKGTVTDPSGSSVPGALIELSGPGGQTRQATGAHGEYAFPVLRAGAYRLRISAKGFAPSEQSDIDVRGAVTRDFQLQIEAAMQTVNVDDSANVVGVDPTQNGSAINMSESQVDSLSDDPDILQQQLKALAGPGAGPDGGNIYVDGFSGAQLPPKASIQEIRINSNPFSPENEQPGGGGIQIITKPGTGITHGNINAIYNKEALNSRNPLLTQSKRPQLKQETLFGFLSGPIKKNKASWTLNFTRNALTQNAFIYATVLDSNLMPAPVNQTVLTPRGNWNYTPRIDYAITPKHSLTVSYFNGHNHVHNLGAGDFGLASRAYDNHGNNNQIQISETAILSPHLVSDTRFQYFRSLTQNTGTVTSPSLVVSGAFQGGGAQVGDSGSISTNLELNSSTSYGYKTHTFRWGGRLRENLLSNTSVNNFGGTFTFQGGSGPMLDADNVPVPGSPIALTVLEVYRRTLLFQREGLNDSAIRALGGGAYQFSIAAGQPKLFLHQFDAGLFVVDDWRARPNVTFSYGLRFESQANIADHADWAPRMAVAWNPKWHGKVSKTVLRAGVGAFYSRTNINTILNTERFNGISQRQYVVLNPSFFPNIPDLSALAASPQQIQLIDSHLRSPTIWQASVGADRQFGKYVRFSVNYSDMRGIHLARPLDINAPLAGIYPFGDPQIRVLTESTGLSRTHQLSITPSINYKKMFLAGFYTLSFGKSDAEGAPADPYNLHTEWGPATYQDTRHRMNLFLSSPLPTKHLSKFTLSLSFQTQSGAPYNITTGYDVNGDTFLTERPGLVAGASASSCTGAQFVFKPAFGCFNVLPAPGAAISRNYGRGPAQTSIGYASLARTWILNPVKETPAKENMVTVPGPGGTSVQVPASIMGGMMGNTAARRTYSLVFSVNAQNPLNHTTYISPSGDLSSPYFGVFRSNAFNSTWNRQVSLQLRLMF